MLMLMCTQKVMWYAAQIADAIHKYAPDYGFKGNIDEFNFGQLIQSRQAYIERIHRSYRMVFERNGVELIQGFARFIDKNTVEVAYDDGTTEQISADHIVIATGGQTVRPDIIGQELGIDSDGFLHSMRCQSVWLSLVQVMSQLRWQVS